MANARRTMAPEKNHALLSSPNRSNLFSVEKKSSRFSRRAARKALVCDHVIRQETCFEISRRRLYSVFGDKHRLLAERACPIFVIAARVQRGLTRLSHRGMLPQVRFRPVSRVLIFAHAAYYFWEGEANGRRPSASRRFPMAARGVGTARDNSN